MQASCLNSAYTHTHVCVEKEKQTSRIVLQNSWNVWVPWKKSRPLKGRYVGGFAGGTVVKSLPVNARDTRDTSSIPGSGRSTGVGNGNPLQCSCLENHMDRSLEGYSPWGCKESDMTEHVSAHAYTHRVRKGLVPPNMESESSIKLILTLGIPWWSSG